MKRLFKVFHSGPATPSPSRRWVVGAVVATVLAAGTAGLLYLRQDPVPADSLTRIQLATTHQTMDGFGTSISDSDPTLITDALADLLWDQQKGIGLSIFRQMISPEGQPTHDPGDFAKAGGWDIWGHVHKALLRNPSLRVVATPMSPPAAWKDNHDTENGGALCAAAGQGLCDADHYSDWAAAVAGFVTLAASQSPPVPIYAIGAQNEPDITAWYLSCRYTPTQMRDFINSLGAALAGLNPRPLLMAPEVANWALLAEYLSVLEADSTASRYVDIYGVHQYGHPAALRPTSSAKPLWQTEMSGLAGGPEPKWDPSITNGLAVAKWIHHAIVTGNVTAWIFWRALNQYGTGSPPAVKDNQDLIIDANRTITNNATVTKRLYTLGNFSKFVRPGSVRVDVGGYVPRGVLVSAYRDPGGRSVVVVINENRSATRLSAGISGGRPPSTVVPWITSATFNLVPQAPIPALGGAFEYLLPGKSVTTFVGD
jgi:glucuronoarabinoxylan endo-1,4-beta-xylanase